MSVTSSFTTGTAISSSAMNANLSDIATEITGSLPRDGQAGMTGQLKASSGSVAAPGMAFSSDSNTGFYLKSADTIGVVAGGSEVATIGTTGIVDSGGAVVSGIPTGALMMFGATTAPTGWVRLNGLTIGNASSAATERANADTSALYSFLWTNYSNTVCPVSTGRGASASADYAANKTIGLPDMRGRSPFGLDDMGNSAASRLTTIAGTTNGTSGGAETVTLAQANLPNIVPTFSGGVTSSNGDHAHSPAANGSFATPGGGLATVGSGGSTLGSTGSTNTTGAHTHTVTGTISSINGNVTQTAVNILPPMFVTAFIMKL